MAPMAYSVSPRLTRATSGGKKRLKRSTRIPTALAAVKWPSSWRMISAAKPAKANNQLMAAPNSCPHRHLLGRDVARAAVGVEERLEGAHRLAGHLLERRLDDGGDAREG